MDLWAIQVNSTTQIPFMLKNPYHYEKPISWKLRKSDDENVLEIRVPKRRRDHQLFVVRAVGKNNHENSNSSSSGNDDNITPEGDGSKGNNSNKSNEPGSQQSHQKMPDWREFRAALFAQEQAETGSHMQEGAGLNSKPLGLKWAHPISSPETGCVLVATEKLDGVRTFERTVVLLLKSGTRHPQEGPFGVVINRPLHKKIKHMKPTNLDLAKTFSDCPLHFGGPLEASMFLLRTGERSRHPGVDEVIPGLCFGARNSLDEAAGLVKKGVLKPRDFRFFVGYAGWQVDQLREEIDSDFWYVAACSADLIFGSSASSSEGLWEEILQLMGGHYSELSRKPKQDI